MAEGKPSEIEKIWSLTTDSFYQLLIANSRKVKDAKKEKNKNEEKEKRIGGRK